MENKRSHHLLFKCRLCGKTFTDLYDLGFEGNNDEDDPHSMLNDLEDMCMEFPNAHCKIAGSADLLWRHHCSAPFDGAIGIADLLGVVPASKYPYPDEEA